MPVGILADVLSTMLDLEFEVRVDMLGLVGVEERYERLEGALREVLARRGFTAVEVPTKPGESNALIRLPGSQISRRPSTRQMSLPRDGRAVTRSATPANGQGPEAQIPEDLQPLYTHLQARLTAREIPVQPQEAIERELARLLRIPPQSAEYGVGKTYVELLLALPWNRVSPDPDADAYALVDADADAEGATEKEEDGLRRKVQSIGQGLEKAREELERDHEGLEEVKKRVLEYLAVYRYVLGRGWDTPCVRMLMGRLKKRNFQQAQREAKVRAQDAMKGVQAADDAAFTETAQGSIDTSTAVDLLELIPESQRHALTAPSSPLPPSSPAAPVLHMGTAQFQDKGPILLLVGPPGVGKTSIARSLASAMGRVMHRISLGGVRDEAEIRGHRRTYVGALPGLLVSALKRTGVSNPLILLDELDKVSSSSHRGDPAAALLEALDPEQNAAFHDHYLGDVTVDLSRVVFVATANEQDPIPPALLDRCEVIQCRGYSEDEKVCIAQRFLVGKQCREAGLERAQVRIEEEAVRCVVEGYTMEVSLMWGTFA
jgi:ATP-dependent Lon protease